MVTESILPLLAETAAVRHQLALLSDDQRQALVHDLADAVLDAVPEILAANQRDQDRMADDNPKKDRLVLTRARLEAIVADTHTVAGLTDPSGVVLSASEIKPGLRLQKVTTPLGVVGMIYEARPNVTVDVCALCLRSGNAVVLRGGSDAEESNRAIVEVVHGVLARHGLATELVRLLPVDRQYVTELLQADQYVDILIPRGSRGLIDHVRAHATVPTIETGAGVCHTYVTATGDLDAGANIVVNAKVSRPSVCNSLDTILVDGAVVAEFLPKIVAGMGAAEVEIYADERAHAVLAEAEYPHLQRAAEGAWGREFLDYKCSVKVVDSYDEALAHIAEYSSRHSEAIVTTDAAQGERFLQEVDAANVFLNASTRFSDGGVYGLGAEIGISTQKLHARGPFALEKLVTEKWVVRGEGHVR